ncbi:hypothetical protein C0Q70_16390 [Pomacea canaliculata]|uniref:AAA+ ATPase domain-containing protein n=1 Tax=Pomacea canaliculata TaxID=400727 RepID=A0A2T7NPM9_POMCA|nr:hypothetical protein C0Q70_16390 [Pomacea canaliculata]
MSAKPSRGLLSPQLDLVQLTRNVTICTRHLKDSVTCLSRPATQVVRDKGFTNHKDYLDAWMPLLEMEAAAEAGDSGLGTMVENVRVTIKREASSSGSGPAVFRGTFRLPTTFCFNRSIEFGGAEPESLKDDEELTGTPSCPLDYLCIRYQVNCGSIIKSKAQASSFAPVIDTHFTWVGHAGVVSVKKVTAGRGGHERIKSGSKKNKAKDKKQQEEVFVEVSFLLTHNSPQPPPQLMVSEGADVFLEIMPKTEVTRNTCESVVILFSFNFSCSSVRACMLTHLCLLVCICADERHLNLGRRSSCEVNVRGLGGKPLPGNNDRQAKAIQTALTNTLSTIQGPPGTGKSYTGVKLVYLFNKINQQLAREGKGKKKTILFCGPSNKSVDHVARILKERLGASCPKLVRMYGSAIETKDYPIPQTHVQTRRGTKDLKSDPSLQEISLHHIIRRNGNKHAEEINQLDNFFARCLEEPNKYKATREDLERHRELVNKASIEELGNYEVILTTCAMGGNKKLVKGAKEQIFQVIIDECAMSPEPHSLVPIVANKAKQVVLIGDHKQLRPIIRCKQAEELGLDQSLFERLYEKYPKQRVFLDKQYRMAEIFVYLKKEFKLDVANIKILSQYNAQRNLIEQRLLQLCEDREVFDRYDQHKVNVSTVVSSQGGEWDYVIVSTVRSLPSYKIEPHATLGWCHQNMGFITDQNQVNVALTRARRGLIIVGDKELLECDPLWKDLIQSYEHEHCIKKAGEFPPPPSRRRRRRN